MAQVMQYLQLPGRDAYISSVERTCPECSIKRSGENSGLKTNNSINVSSHTTSNNINKSEVNVNVSRKVFDNTKANTNKGSISSINTATAANTKSTTLAASNNSSSSNDKYTAAIELSNKCREFYNSRLEAANTIKSRWRRQQQNNNHDLATSSSSSSSPSSLSSSSSKLSITTEAELHEDNHDVPTKRPSNSIDRAMDRLRTEMVSLMEQDLSLMKQLLTLNETIEELKWQRQHLSCSTSSCVSLSPSGRLIHWAPDTALGGSNDSVSDTEMYDSDDDDNLQLAAPHTTGPALFRGPSHNTQKMLVSHTPDASSSSSTPSPLQSSSSKTSKALPPLLSGLSSPSPVTQPSPAEIITTNVTRHGSQKAEHDRFSLDSLAARLEQVATLEEGDLTSAVLAALRQRSVAAGTPDTPGTGSSSSLDSPNRYCGSGGGYQSADESLGLTSGPVVRHDRDQHSFDSGIHEPGLDDDIVWNV